MRSRRGTVWLAQWGRGLCYIGAEQSQRDRLKECKMAFLVSPTIDLDARLELEFADGDLSASIDSYNVDGMTLRSSTAFSFFLFGIRVPDELVERLPTRMSITNASAAGYAAQLGCFIIAEELKMAIEALEPGVHQFIPIQAQHNHQSLQYYYLNVLVKLEPVIPEYSTVEWYTPPGGSAPALVPKSVPMGSICITLKRSVIDGHHLWCGTPKHMISKVWVSNQLHDNYVSARMRGWDFRHCPEQD